MTSTTMKTPLRVYIWVLLGLGLLFAANGHLVYVAMTSQPECVAHVRSGGPARDGSFSAAKSSCTPTRQQ